jgi:hypothetical protein
MFFARYFFESRGSCRGKTAYRLPVGPIGEADLAPPSPTLLVAKHTLRPLRPLRERSEEQ